MCGAIVSSIPIYTRSSGCHSSRAALYSVVLFRGGVVDTLFPAPIVRRFSMFVAAADMKHIATMPSHSHPTQQQSLYSVRRPKVEGQQWWRFSLWHFVWLFLPYLSERNETITGGPCVTRHGSFRVSSLFFPPFQKSPVVLNWSVSIVRLTWGLRSPLNCGPQQSKFPLHLDLAGGFPHARKWMIITSDSNRSAWFGCENLSLSFSRLQKKNGDEFLTSVREERHFWFISFPMGVDVSGQRRTFFSSFGISHQICFGLWGVVIVGKGGKNSFLSFLLSPISLLLLFSLSKPECLWRKRKQPHDGYGHPSKTIPPSKKVMVVY